MFNLIWNSIRKPSSYKKLTQTSSWKIALTLVAFFTIISVIHSLLLANLFNPFLTFMEKDFPTKMPSFTYDGTQLQVDGKTPITLYNVNRQQVVVDVSAPTPQDSVNKITNGFVFGKTEMYIVQQGSSQSLSYSQMMMPPLTKNDVTAITPILKPLFIVGLIVWTIISVGWSFVEITFFSLFALMLASIRRIRLPYGKIWLVSAFAMIPATFITILNTFFPSGYLDLAFWVAIITYMYHGVGSFAEGRE